MTGSGSAKREQTIKEQVEELNELLLTLIASIDNLVERNPQPTSDMGVSDTVDNVFDEIMDKLQTCRRRVREATDKVQDQIANKVH